MAPAAESPALAVRTGEAVTAADTRVTDLIRGAIIRGEYAPNQRLIEADLSGAFAASRATVDSTAQ